MINNLAKPAFTMLSQSQIFNLKDLRGFVPPNLLPINTLHHKTPFCSFNSKFIHIDPNQTPLHAPVATLDELMFEYNFNPSQQPKGHDQQIQSCPSTKETNPSEPNIYLEDIQTLQFEANNPIQDKICNKRLKSIDAECVSIFDGHGGNTLAEYASKKINQLIDSYLFSHLSQQQQSTLDIIKQSIQWAYGQIQQSFCELLQQQFKKGNKDIIKVGTCAITCIVWNNHIILANSGDSQAVIVYEDQTGLCLFKANKQLNTSNSEEVLRIQKQFQGIDDHVLVKSKLNQKIYIKGILQPTRTLGDYYLKKQKYFNKVSKATKTQFKGPYIKHTPEVKVIPIESSFRYLILASDGLWDFATSKQIQKIAENHHSAYRQSVQPFSEHELNKAYIEKPFTQSPNKLTQSLRDHVLEKCAKKKNKTLPELLQIPPGERRNFCDDISIIALTFRQDTFP